jgi:hypothetical protein
MNIGYDDTKNRQGGGESPLAGRYKDEHGFRRFSWKGLGRTIGKVEKKVKQTAQKIRSGKNTVT